MVAVAVMVSALLWGGTQAVAQEKRVSFFTEQFKASHEACEEIENWGCVKVIDRGLTVRDIIEAFPLATIKVVKEANGWGDEMIDQVIPPGLFFKLRHTPLRISSNST